MGLVLLGAGCFFSFCLGTLMVFWALVGAAGVTAESGLPDRKTQFQLVLILALGLALTVAPIAMLI